jgi:hypothetical protein
MLTEEGSMKLSSFQATGLHLKKGSPSGCMFPSNNILVRRSYSPSYSGCTNASLRLFITTHAITIKDLGLDGKKLNKGLDKGAILVLREKNVQGKPPKEFPEADESV